MGSSPPRLSFFGLASIELKPATPDQNTGLSTFSTVALAAVGAFAAYQFVSYCFSNNSNGGPTGFPQVIGGSLTNSQIGDNESIASSTPSQDKIRKVYQSQLASQNEDTETIEARSVKDGFLIVTARLQRGPRASSQPPADPQELSESNTSAETSAYDNDFVWVHDPEQIKQATPTENRAALPNPAQSCLVLESKRDDESVKSISSCSCKSQVSSVRTLDHQDLVSVQSVRSDNSRG